VSRGNRPENPLALAVAALLALGLAACEPDAAAAPAAEAGVAASAPTPWVAVTPAVRAASLRVPARVVADSAGRAEVRSALDGLLATVDVRVGDTVVAGQLVATVRIPEVIQARARLGALGRRITLSRQRHGELVRLRREGLAVRASEFELAATVARLEAERDGLRALLESARDPACRRRPARVPAAEPLCAPTDGVVVAAAGVVGAVAGPDHPPVAVLRRRGPGRIEVRHPRPPPAEATLTFVGEDGSRVPLHPEPLAEAVDALDGARLAWHRAVGDRPLPAGLRGEVLLGLPGAIVRVPASAIRLEAGGSVVALRGRAGKPCALPVAVHAVDGAAALVSGALRVGDRVAADAALLGDLEPADNAEKSGSAR